MVTCIFFCKHFPGVSCVIFVCPFFVRLPNAWWYANGGSFSLCLCVCKKPTDQIKKLAHIGKRKMARTEVFVCVFEIRPCVIVQWKFNTHVSCIALFFLKNLSEYLCVSSISDCFNSIFLSFDWFLLLSSIEYQPMLIYQSPTNVKVFEEIFNFILKWVCDMVSDYHRTTCTHVLLCLCKLIVIRFLINSAWKSVLQSVRNVRLECALQMAHLKWNPFWKFLFKRITYWALAKNKSHFRN